MGFRRWIVGKNFTGKQIKYKTMQICRSTCQLHQQSVLSQRKHYFYRWTEFWSHRISLIDKPMQISAKCNSKETEEFSMILLWNNYKRKLKYICNKNLVQSKIHKTGWFIWWICENIVRCKIKLSAMILAITLKISCWWKIISLITIFSK